MNTTGAIFFGPQIISSSISWSMAMAFVHTDDNAANGISAGDCSQLGLRRVGDNSQAAMAMWIPHVELRRTT